MPPPITIAGGGTKWREMSKEWLRGFLRASLPL